MTALSGCISISRERKQSTTVESVDARPLEGLSVHAVDGDVTIERGADETVEIRAVKHARGDIRPDQLVVDATVDGTHLGIETRLDDSFPLADGWIDLRLSVPQSVAVQRVAVTHGDLVLNDVVGGGHIRVTDGDINATRTVGDLDVQVEHGDITIAQTDGAVAASVIDGDVAVRESGPLRTIEVVEGDVTLGISEVAHDSIVETIDGDITARLNRNLDAHITASTADGDVAGAAALETLEVVSETYLEGMVGDGTGTLELAATDGDITVR